MVNIRKFVEVLRGGRVALKGALGDGSIADEIIVYSVMNDSL